MKTANVATTANAQPKTNAVMNATAARPTKKKPLAAVLTTSRNNDGKKHSVPYGQYAKA